MRNNPHLPLVHDYMWIDESEIDKTEFHNWLERESGMRYRLGGFVANSGQYFGITAVQRSRRQGPAGEREHCLFLHLLPHIRRAARISREFSTLHAERMLLFDELQQARYGILFLDNRARALFVNRTGERVLALRDGLCLDRNGYLRAERSDERQALGRLFASAMLKTAVSAEKLRSIFTVSRPSGKRPFLLRVVPYRFSRFEPFLNAVPSIAVFLREPEEMSGPTEELLRQVFKLTPAEARFAATLIKAESLKEAATNLRLTEGSARQTLKRIFSKTDCHSQTALIKLLLSFPGH